MFCVYTEVMAQDDTVTFEIFQLLLTHFHSIIVFYSYCCCSCCSHFVFERPYCFSTCVCGVRV